MERYQGDLNDTSAQPQLRYLGQEGQYADGVFNPMKEYGYMNPANASFATLTGTIAAPINSIQYDPEDDIVYLSEEGENILKLDGLDDTSLTNYLSVTSGSTIKDMLVYEVGGNKALVYSVDSNNEDDGMFVGFSLLNSGDVVETLDIDYDPTTAAASDDFLLSPAIASSKLAQKFSTDDLTELTATYFRLHIRRNAGTGVGITLKVSIQGDLDRDSSPYTYKGAWTDATSYVQNDTVENNGVTYACVLAHTSSGAAGSGNEPGVADDNWEVNWTVFAAPDGVAQVSNTFALSDVADVDFDEDEYEPHRVDFTGGEHTFTAGETLWIVIEEVGSNMTASDGMTWLHTDNDNALLSGMYAKEFGQDYETWRSVSIQENPETFGFGFGRAYTEYEKWTSELASGAFDVETGQDTYLYLADNALAYWFVGKSVHTIDGGGTGGSLGRVVENVLTFPTYISVADVAETRSRMYIGVQTSNNTSTVDNRYYTAKRSGIYIWDRRSQVLGGTDFYPTPGAQEIKKLFTSSDGSVKAITVGGTGFTEIRAASGNQFAVIHTLDREAYPDRRGISQVDGLSVWLGANGIFYAFGSVAPGEPERLYKIGDMSAEANAGLVTGPVFIGHEESTEPRVAVVFGWSDNDPSYTVQKWYPNGDGTISSTAQLANAGNVYSLLTPLPSFSNVRYINIFGIPTETNSADTIATVKIYFNQSTTAWAEKVITKADMNKGYYEIPVNKQNVNFVQVEIEWSTTEVLGADTFRPMYAEVDIQDEEMGGRNV